MWEYFLYSPNHLETNETTIWDCGISFQPDFLTEKPLISCSLFVNFEGENAKKAIKICYEMLQLHMYHVRIIDRTSLADKSARKDEKTLFWPPPISIVWLPN